jgi:Ca2+-binding RTX toxin-like protein
MRGVRPGRQYERMRTFLLSVSATLVLGALVSLPSASQAATTCAGRRVTIDLSRPGHPDPDRPASDVVLGTGHSDKITTGRGDDIVCGGRGHDLIDLGPGNDVGLGQRGGAVLNGGPGDDRLVGDPRNYSTAVDFRTAPRGVHVDLGITGPQETRWGRDTITGIANILGSAHDDVLRTRVLSHPSDSWHRHALLSGGAGNDLLVGSRVANRFLGGEGDDVMRGGGGADRFDEYLSDENGGADTVYGGAGGDVIEAATAGDHYEGGAGDDILTVAECLPTCPAGLRELLGGAGDDKFTLDQGDELVDGGDGVDLIDENFYPGSEGGVLTVDLAIAGPQDTGIGGTDDISDVEKVVGGAWFDNHLSGNDVANVLVGYGGDDVINGRGGNDTLDGNSGNDALDGGEGDDSCAGGSGSDTFASCETTTDE